MSRNRDEQQGDYAFSDSYHSLFGGEETIVVTTDKVFEGQYTRTIVHLHHSPS